MYRLLYSALWYFLCPFILLRLFLRARKNQAHKQNWQQRLGHIECARTPRIWLHAVSVGETIAARTLAEAILKHYPSHSLLISNTTLTGSQTAKRLFGDRVEHCYFPYDLPHAVSRFLKKTTPDILIIMETEIWPNLLHQCNKQSIPVLIANARLSARSTQGYSRIHRLIKPTLNNVSKIACRSQQDAKHFLQLGANVDQLVVSGNIKFDIPQPVLLTEESLTIPANKNSKVLVAASTHRGEDEIILNIFKALKLTHPDLLLILVPRHPERFDEVFTLCEITSFTTQRRSDVLNLNQPCDIILGDSLGEMALWYSAADVVFMGGSLVNTGGHNPLEATVYGVPVVCGPAVFNFQDIFEILCEVQLAWVEDDATALQDKINELLELTSEQLLKLKENADTVLIQNSGVTGRLMLEIKKHLPSDIN